MAISRLVVKDLRNLDLEEWCPDLHVNFLQGENGSGKTSLLEAIYMMSTGRSFRTRKFRSLIAYDRPAFHLYSEFRQRGVPHRLGVIRQKDGTSTFQLDGAPVLSATELAALLPCLVLNTESFELLDGGPSERRAFIDWLVFHVKPGFSVIWSDYNRCLKQRNSLLRSGKVTRSDLVVWDRGLAQKAASIDALRREVLAELLPVCEMYFSECEFIGRGQFEMAYHPGWSTSTFEEQLSANFDKDVALGFTSSGPHRAEILFQFNGRRLAELFSRGQKKTLTAALYLGQLDVFRRNNTLDCLLLLDDLPAELDGRSVGRLCEWLRHLRNLQMFVTGVDLEFVASVWGASSNAPHPFKKFHVKQGQVFQISH